MKYIDLSHTLEAHMPVFPGDTEVEFQQTVTFEKNECNCHTVKTPLHAGTHIDAPYHMVEGGKKLSEFPVSHFFGTAHLIDARGEENIHAGLLLNRFISRGDIVLVAIGWYHHFGEAEYYESYPEVTKEFALALVELGVKMLGLDTPSPDRDPYEIHRILLPQDILIIENITNTDALLGSNSFSIAALPLKFPLDGSPARVVAMIEEKTA